MSIKKKRKNNSKIILLSILGTIAVAGVASTVFDMNELGFNNSSSENENTSSEEKLELLKERNFECNSSLCFAECMTGDECCYLPYDTSKDLNLKLVWNMDCLSGTYSDTYYFTPKDSDFTIGKTTVEAFTFTCIYNYNYPENEDEDDYTHICFSTDADDLEELAGELNITSLSLSIYKVL